MREPPKLPPRRQENTQNQSDKSLGNQKQLPPQPATRKPVQSITEPLVQKSSSELIESGSGSSKRTEELIVPTQELIQEPIPSLSANETIQDLQNVQDHTQRESNSSIGLVIPQPQSDSMMEHDSMMDLDQPMQRNSVIEDQRTRSSGSPVPPNRRPSYRPLPRPPGRPHSPGIGSPTSPTPVFQGGVFLGYNAGSTLQQRPDFHPDFRPQYMRPRPGGPMYVRPPPDQQPLGLQFRPRPDFRPVSMPRPGHDFQPRPMPRPHPDARPLMMDDRRFQGSDFQGRPALERPPMQIRPGFRPPPPGWRPPHDSKPPPGWRPPPPHDFRPDMRYRPFPPDFRPLPGMVPDYRNGTFQGRPGMRPQMVPGMRPPFVHPDAIIPRPSYDNLGNVPMERTGSQGSRPTNSPAMGSRGSRENIPSPDEQIERPPSPGKRKASEEISSPTSPSKAFATLNLEMSPNDSISQGPGSPTLDRNQPVMRPPPMHFVPRPIPVNVIQPSYMPLEVRPRPPLSQEVRPSPSYMPIDASPPMRPPPPQLIQAPIMNPQLPRQPSFSSFPLRPEGVYRNNSININPSVGPTPKRSFDKGGVGVSMIRSESLDDRSLSRKKAITGPVSPVTESDAEYDTDSESRRSSVVNLDVAPRPTFVTLSRRKPGMEELSIEQLIEQQREKASKSSDPKVQFEFAKSCLAAGEPYVEEGFALLKKVASGGFPEANYFLGDAFADDGKHSMAYSQYLMAAKRGYAPACHAIASCAEVGRGCKKNTRLSLEMYTKAATAGNLESMYRLGMAELNGDLGLRPDVNKAVKWFKRAAAVPNRDHPEPLFELAKIYETGVPPYINQDFAYARGVLIEASDFGFPPAIYKLGYCHEHGLMGFDVNPAESIRLYNVAMNSGDPDAMLGMAGWYMTGADGILAKNEERAFNLVKEAAEKNLPRAQYTLGYFYEGGIGTEKNLDLAFKFYYLAAERGEDRAISRIQRSDPDAKLFAKKNTKKKKNSFLSFFSK